MNCGWPGATGRARGVAARRGFARRRSSAPRLLAAVRFARRSVSRRSCVGWWSRQECGALQWPHASRALSVAAGSATRPARRRVVPSATRRVRAPAQCRPNISRAIPASTARRLGVGFSTRADSDRSAWPGSATQPARASWRRGVWCGGGDRSSSRRSGALALTWLCAARGGSPPARR